MNLNRRHKAALCGTLICVGLIVLLGGSVRLIVGIGLLGVAFSWALGANQRAVHWLFAVFGMCFLIPPIWDGFAWPYQKADAINGQNEIAQTDADIVKTQMSLLAEASNGPERAKARAELDKAMNEQFHDKRELRRLQAEGIFLHVIRTDWQPLVCGSLLLCSGIGLLLRINLPKAE